jgi:hypothetical protein
MQDKVIRLLVYSLYVVMMLGVGAVIVLYLEDTHVVFCFGLFWMMLVKGTANVFFENE